MIRGIATSIKRVNRNMIHRNGVTKELYVSKRDSPKTYVDRSYFNFKTFKVKVIEERVKGVKNG